MATAGFGEVTTRPVNHSGPVLQIDDQEADGNGSTDLLESSCLPSDA